MQEDLLFNIRGDSSQLRSAVQQSIGLVDQFGRTVVNTQKQAQQATDRADAAFRKLRSSIDPAYVATRRLESGQRVLKAQLDAGKLSAEEHARMMTLLANRYAIAEGQAATFNSQVRASRFATGNLFAQFQDIGVMMASGQSPLLLAIQQGSQINQIFAAMPNNASKIATLTAAFKQMINPSQLVVIGLIAGAAALFQWGRNALTAEEGTEELKSAIDELRESTISAKDELELLTSGLRSLEQLNVQRRVNDLMEERATLAREINRIAEEGTGRERQGQRHRRETLASLDQEIAKLQEALVENENVNVELENTRRLREEEIKLIDQITSAIERAEAAEFQRRQAYRQGLQQTGVDFNILRSLTGNMMINGQPTGIETSILPEPDDGKEERSGGRSRDPREELAEELARLEDSFKSKIELQMDQYAEEQALLENALEQKLLTEQEYMSLIEQARKRHTETLAQLDAYRYGSDLQKAGQFFGDMASAFKSGNEELLRISKAFGAAQALINAWEAFSQTMRDPTLPWFAKFAAAASVFGSAVQAVSAIQSVGQGGTGQRSPSGSSTPGAVSAAPAAPQVQRSLTLIGDRFNRAQMIAQAEFFNEGTDDGLVIRGR